ncbi:hypothetical protein [Rhodanobacter sp. DHB23]|uniref:hypothetical protein n=1 Tax=Rhodanobacter sp. DHB23 TaxID=2775923 RepID=UPI00177BD918|nr:hypothetical protein [Rhodanobacter sp. DHB23]MBD8872332.1 hypothetical protein [Rhodanobacter sp. DHB23]
MSPFTAFITPWRTVHRSLRWLGGVVSLLLCVAATVVAFSVRDPHGWLFGLMLYAFGAAYFWLCVMACLLLVATDARRLRLPGVERVVAGSMLLYGLASVALPLALFMPARGDAATITLVSALAAGAGLAVALLPRYFTLVLGFLPALAIGARHRIHVPFPGEPGFVALGAALLVVLVMVNMFRWRQLLRAEAPVETGMGGAMVMQYRHSGAMAGSYGALGAAWGDTLRHDGAASAHLRQGKATPSVCLDGVGPNSPVLALRVALGENLAPQTLRAHARRFMRLGLPLLLFIPAMAVMQAGEAHGDVLHKVMRGVGINVIAWFGLMGGMALMAMGSLLPWARWRRANAELPLLALLPGLGEAASLRRDLLRAALGRPLALQALLLALVLGVALAMHAGPSLLLFATLCQFGCAAVVAASVLGAFGGKALPGWGMGVLLTGMGALAAASTFVPLFATLGKDPQPLAAGAVAGLAVAWATATMVLLWLGRRGWRGLRQRPHPFLAN